MFSFARISLINFSALMYKSQPNSSLVVKNEKCQKGKFAKDHLTLLLTCNASRTEKFKPFVIERFAKPHAFRNVKSLPLDYTSRTKAWMASKLFAKWLLRINNKMKKENRKILMMIDNCSAHNSIPEMEDVKVKFLPPKTLLCYNLLIKVS